MNKSEQQRSSRSVFQVRTLLKRFCWLLLALCINGSSLVLLMHTAHADASSTWSFGSVTSAPVFNRTDITPGIIQANGNLWVQFGSATNGQVSWLRYQGTTLDNLVQQPNAVLDSSFTQPNGDDKYWAEGLWSDPSTGTWYTDVHVEYGYPVWSRRIILATSTNQGATWHNQGDIITDDASQAPPAGYTKNFGDGDQRLLVDTAGGYFYLFYMSGWWNANNSSYPLTSTLYFDVARCPISAKMAPGCWQKFGDGSWNQPGLGGLDTKVLPAPPIGTDPTSIYPTFPTTLAPAIMYNTYLHTFVALGKGWMSTATSLTQQNWTTPSSFSSFPTWYNWCVDPNTWSRDVVGQTCRLYTASDGVFTPGEYETVTFSPLPSWVNLGGGLADSPGTASWGSNELDVFIRGTDNQLYQDSWNGSSWSGFTSLGGPPTATNPGTFQGAPAAISRAANEINVYVRGNDNALWQRSYFNGQWHGWVSLGGALADSPAASSWSSNDEEVFVRGTNNQLFQDSWNGGTGNWSGFTQLGGPTNSTFVGTPAAISRTANEINVYVRGNDNALWQQSYYNGQWHTWTSLGGALADSPTASSWDANTEAVFVRGTDNQVYENAWNGSLWSGFTVLGGPTNSTFTGAPAAISRPSGGQIINLFVRGNDNALWMAGYWNNQWH